MEIAKSFSISNDFLIKITWIWSHILDSNVLWTHRGIEKRKGNEQKKRKNEKICMCVCVYNMIHRNFIYSDLWIMCLLPVYDFNSRLQSFSQIWCVEFAPHESKPIKCWKERACIPKTIQENEYDGKRKSIGINRKPKMKWNEAYHSKQTGTRAHTENFTHKPTSNVSFKQHSLSKW